MTPRVTLKLALLTNPGGIIGTVAPAFVNAFVASGMSIAVASRMAAAEFFAMAATLLLAPLLVRRIDRRWMATVSLVCAVLGQLLSLSADTPAFIFSCRVVAGAGEGALFAVALASLSAAPSPERAFGMAILSNQVAGTLLLAAIAWLTKLSPANVALWVAGGFIAIHALLIPALPRSSGGGQDSQGRTAGKGAAFAILPILCGLGGMALLSAGFGVVWPMIGQVGVAADISPNVLTTTLSVVGLGGIAGGLAATMAGSRFGDQWPVVVGALMMALCMPLLASHMFAVAAVLTLFCWAFNLPYFLGFLAKRDEAGGLAVLTSAMIPFGIAAGQLVAGPIVQSVGIAGIAPAGSIAVVGALAMKLIGSRVIRGSPDIASTITD